ncbi:helix-turn-helix transcriptional regulator [Streptomyces sp. H10-C2]|uniref:helix-turn-helix domain-containing protein n=1 Tax=unclassified Streptomyces TaxID=2593676 RepID=UPI0024BA15C4|nr:MULTISPECIES: helix-turn-helix transcriptional regulator [unclassified Streptomyces]MDJ0343442.1 helix-turn-helix transcriptional regulator [Streptomyces sp. PH10-H1]MDJ0371522.1 helix-turn-helix transcriptional regulator [Streptomyces sp. H10-C2]
MRLIEGLTRSCLLDLAYLGGDWDALHERVAALRTELPEMSQVQDTGCRIEAHLALARGERTRALEHLSNIAPRGVIEVHLGLRDATIGTLIRLNDDDPAAAWTVAEPAARLLRRSGRWAMSGSFVPIAVQAALGRGRRAEAEDLVHDLEVNLEGRDAPHTTAEMARLLAAGATNRDIAQSLFLASRTVEHHVAKVLKKLGATRRGEVKDALERQQL